MLRLKSWHVFQYCRTGTARSCDLTQALHCPDLQSLALHRAAVHALEGAAVAVGEAFRDVSAARCVGPCPMLVAAQESSWTAAWLHSTGHSMLPKVFHPCHHSHSTCNGECRNTQQVMQRIDTPRRTLLAANDFPVISSQTACQVPVSTLASRSAADDILYRSPAMPQTKSQSSEAGVQHCSAMPLPPISVALWCIGFRDPHVCDSLLRGVCQVATGSTDGRPVCIQMQSRPGDALSLRAQQRRNWTRSERPDGKARSTSRRRDVLASLVFWSSF